jgi:hypothetical protein
MPVELLLPLIPGQGDRSWVYIPAEEAVAFPLEADLVTQCPGMEVECSEYHAHAPTIVRCPEDLLLALACRLLYRGGGRGRWRWWGYFHWLVAWLSHLYNYLLICLTVVHCLVVPVLALLAQEFLPAFIVVLKIDYDICTGG